MSLKKILRRRFIQTGLGACNVSLLGISAYTFGVEPHWVEIVHRPLPVRYLPASWQGKRIVQLSDLHVGPQVSDDYLIHCLEKVRDLKPDLILLTGDYISYEDEGQFSQLRHVLQYLPPAPMGVFSVLGNHDYGHNWSQPEVADHVVEELYRAGAVVLKNESANIDGLVLIGVDDYWGPNFQPQAALQDWTPETPALVLLHNPDGIDQFEFQPYKGWALCGHTHGGQCKPPFLPPPLLPVQNKRYIAGEIAVDSHKTLYINRGLGHLLQVRFNVRPEITVFTLKKT